MTAVDLDVPPGTPLLLHSNEVRPEPADGSVLVRVVAVYRQAIGGYVWVRAHACTEPESDCGSGWCWEAQVLVEAIRANLAGTR